MNKIKKELSEFKLLLRCVPPVPVILFIMSVLAMNLLANKSIDLPFEWLSLDCGIIVSWFAFLTMDIITTHFGPKAANQISLLAIFFNLLFCLIFFLGSKIPGAWGESYVTDSEKIINTALDNTFGGTWYVVFGSTVAFAVSAFINNTINFVVGKVFRKKQDTLFAYILRSYVSTAVAQFADNLIFALIVSHFFFGWSLLQCITCALTGMLFELLSEVLFSLFGYKITKNWKKENVGEQYFRYREENK